MEPAAPPVLLMARRQLFAAAPAAGSAKSLAPAVCAHSWATSCMFWPLVKVPKRPNTKPATAMAAMRVIAISMTVARTGEIAFLRLGLLILIYSTCLYAAEIAEKASGEPLATTREPETAAPGVSAAAESHSTMTGAPAVVPAGTA